MNRVETVKNYVDCILDKISDSNQKSVSYSHLNGVSLTCTLIALKRNQNVELACIAGMLHDIYTFANNDSYDHAHKGAILANSILQSLKVFSDNEIEIICLAIHNHSSKNIVDDSFCEVLKDGDVLQHALYNPLVNIALEEQNRYDLLKIEFGIN